MAELLWVHMGRLLNVLGLGPISSAIWRTYSPLAALCLQLYFASEDLNMLVKMQRG